MAEADQLEEAAKKAAKMKIMEPGGNTMTPQSQMWAGVVLALIFFAGGISTVTRPMDTLDRLTALVMLSGVPLWAIVAWYGYRRQKSDGD